MELTLLSCFIATLLNISAALWDNPCSYASNANKPFCDQSLSFRDRAHDLIYNQISKLSDYLTAFQGLSGNTAKAVPELNIPAYQWWNEALHGICCGHGENCNGPIYNTTMFPEPITTACSFNASLFYEIGNAIGIEGRAMWNSNESGLTFWAPNINIFRDPRWGRGMETPGEDPFLNSIYATNFIRGLQGYYENNKYLKASSCPKHYADYSLENADGVTRHNFNAIVSDYDQNDTYLVAFKYAVIDANASGIMCSYNAENGIPSCANKELLTGYLREEMGFYGYITSDCGAVSNVMNTHHYTNTTGETIDAVFSAGMDLDCGGFTENYLADAVSNGTAKLSDIQRAIYDAALVQFRLGFFDTNQAGNPYNKYGPSDVCTKQHTQLSLEATLQSIVLLKNIKNTLPLKIGDYKTVALIGPNANNTVVIQGNYHGIPCFIYSVWNGLQTYYTDDSDILYEKGCDMDSNDTSGFAKAINAAKTADVTILVMGLDTSQEGEGHDRTSLALPGVQNELIGNITASSTGPVILVIMSGGCVDISQWRDNDKIMGIIYAGYPGMYGGLALSNIIYGDYNPSGRLTQTWYYQNFTQQMLMTNMNMTPNKTTNSTGRGYRYFPGEVVYKFGDGLSYTSFNCSKVILNNYETPSELSVEITNIGAMDGSAVVLVYFIPNDSGKNQIPIQRLVAFGRVNELEMGKTVNLTMNVYKEVIGSDEQRNGGQYVASGACM